MELLHVHLSAMKSWSKASFMAFVIIGSTTFVTVTVTSFIPTVPMLRSLKRPWKKTITSRVELGIFVWGGQVAILIYLSRQLSYTYIYTHVFLLYIHTYIHTFLFGKLYIYTHPKKKKKISIFNQNYIWCYLS